MTCIAVLMMALFIACEQGQQPKQESLKKVEDLPGVEGLLTINDVEQVTGLTGIKLVPRDPKKGAGGNLNFATADDKLLTMLVIADMDIFDQWKNAPNYAGQAVTGVGDEAYLAPKGQDPYIIVFRKGNKVASISSFPNVTTGESYLSVAQLKALANIVESRM
jgi:hypothetical protein